MRKTQMINRDQIAERAFQIWENEGQPHGRDQEHWQRAEAELRDHMARMKPVRTRKPATKPVAETPAKASAKPVSKAGKAKAVKAATAEKV